jgi:nitroreductase
MLHRRYLVDPTRVNFREQFGPSTPMACEICAGVAATQVLKLLLGRGKILAAPRGIAHRRLHPPPSEDEQAPGQQEPVPAPRVDDRAASVSPLMPMRMVETILEIARWAPSGDNTQPWRFEILDDRRFVVHGFDTRDWCLYDIDGRPSQIALGALAREHRDRGQRARDEGIDRPPRRCAGRSSDVRRPARRRARYAGRSAGAVHRRAVGAAARAAVAPAVGARQAHTLEAAVGPDHSVSGSKAWPTGARLRR